MVQCVVLTHKMFISQWRVALKFKWLLLMLFYSLLFLHQAFQLYITSHWTFDVNVTQCQYWYSDYENNDVNASRYERVDELIWVKTNQLQRIIRTGRTGHWLNHGKEHCLVSTTA